jgi:hypothetical protein
MKFPNDELLELVDTVPFPSSFSVHTNIDKHEHGVRFPNDMRFERVDMVQRELKGTVGREWDAFSPVVPTVHGTSFLGLRKA